MSGDARLVPWGAAVAVNRPRRIIPVSHPRQAAGKSERLGSWVRLREKAEDRIILQIHQPARRVLDRLCGQRLGPG